MFCVLALKMLTLLAMFFLNYFGAYDEKFNYLSGFQ